ncbi:MAG: hypothetical protein COU65_04120 [Candidatus Pacebacteria bacterium CG10_big_fil_rev_8_21_14_0_10_42_12]|nr:MAG: hypothetical protein COU65_04120 [Candidatus Pacebacteria bacterium CG10_big_fil_rev_8_21_14_0_10_42_12]
MKKILKKIQPWFDEYALIVLSGFLLAFIPLYPKLPLFDIIPGYLVRVRIEDFFVALAVLIWIIQVARKKIVWKTPLTKPVVYYMIAGFLSILSAVFITKTVPAELLHVGKTTLHYFRYIEYFSIFFILFSAIKTKKHLEVLLKVLFGTILVIIIYGFGQKYFYWPVYSTMNREFSKGLRLYLTEHARVQSTFGGHYDLGGYLVLMLPLVLAASYAFVKKSSRFFLRILFFFGTWQLIVGASRSSFASFFVAIGIVLLFFTFDQKTIWKKIKWLSLQLLSLGFMIGILLSIFGEDINERFLQTLEGFPELNSTYHRLNGQRKDFMYTYLPQVTGITTLRDRLKPDNGISTDEATLALDKDNVLVPSDQRPTTERPGDVYVNVPDLQKVASTSADGTVTYTTIEVERTYSDNALIYGLSYAIRLDSLWPRAISGFTTNPVFGSGYATLTKEAVGQFTEAESTDNNYLRALGETGLAGFLTFFGAVFLAIWLSFKTLTKKISLNGYEKTIIVGFISGSIGLLVNAMAIDIFAASKVAFSFWALAGMALSIYVKKNKTKRKFKK